MLNQMMNSKLKSWFKMWPRIIFR